MGDLCCPGPSLPVDPQWLKVPDDVQVPGNMPLVHFRHSTACLELVPVPARRPEAVPEESVFLPCLPTVNTVNWLWLKQKMAPPSGRSGTLARCSESTYPPISPNGRQQPWSCLSSGLLLGAAGVVPPSCLVPRRYGVVVRWYGAWC